MTAKNYRDLIVWQKATQFVLEIYYEETAGFPSEERYGPEMQLRKAGVSVPSNLAEGQGRRSTGDFLHHPSIARGSLRELETQLLISERLKYLKNDSAARLMEHASEIG